MRPTTTIRQLAAAAPPPRRPRVVFSGIQPTGVPHIGNHLGALSKWQELVAEQRALAPDAPRDRLVFSVVGLHALTVPQDPRKLVQDRRDMFSVLLALGLHDPKLDLTVFHQDDVSEHAELAWYLNCSTSVGRLLRMTSWKSKLATVRNANSELEVDDSLLQLGLLAYPVLQTADILLYKATHVPVGNDQTQHLELCRDLAESFNRQYPARPPANATATPSKSKGKRKGVFTVPQVMLTDYPRIQSLRHPESKMSKSSPDPGSVVFLTDAPEVVCKKLRAAVTDSVAGGPTFDPVGRPGVSNLLAIHAAYSGQPVAETVARFAGRDRAVAAFKDEVADVVAEGLREFRTEFARIRSDPGWVDEMERAGADRARAIARETMQQVRRAVGTAA
ncbi:hypothetical protein JCM11491_001349 [Sporobolomyces phaffii]